jgi:hypothetical protein
MYVDWYFARCAEAVDVYGVTGDARVEWLCGIASGSGTGRRLSNSRQDVTLLCRTIPRLQCFYIESLVRVTRLGDLSPIGSFITFGGFMKTTEVA